MLSRRTFTKYLAALPFAGAVGKLGAPKKPAMSASSASIKNSVVENSPIEKGRIIPITDCFSLHVTPLPTSNGSFVASVSWMEI